MPIDSDILEKLRCNDASTNELYLAYRILTVTDVQVLCHALTGNTNLQSLDLTSCVLHADAAKLLGEVLKNNTGLQLLILGNNYLTAEGLKYLAEGLKINTSLQTLNLWNTAPMDEGLAHLAEALKINRSLRSLIISHNKLTNESAKHLAKAIKNNTALKSLNLCGNCLTADGAKYLAEALMGNKSIQSLDLQLNKLTDEGVKYLVEVLKSDTNIQMLNLCGNQLMVEGALYLADALKGNTSLQSLDLMVNNLTAAGMKYLGEALEANTTLLSLDLRANCVNIPVQIDGYLKRNKTLAEERKHLMSSGSQAETKALIEPREQELNAVGADAEQRNSKQVDLNANVEQLEESQTPSVDGYEAQRALLAQQSDLLNQDILHLNETAIHIRDQLITLSMLQSSATNHPVFRQAPHSVRQSITIEESVIGVMIEGFTISLDLTSIPEDKKDIVNSEMEKFSQNCLKEEDIKINTRINKIVALTLPTNALAQKLKEKLTAILMPIVKNTAKPQRQTESL